MYVHSDEPFCCASFRCSLPQRRALPRRVSPFIQQKQLSCFFPFCFWYHLIRSIKPFSSCSSSGVIHKSNPLLLRLLTASLPSLLLRLLLRESWRSSQKTLHPNRRSPDVRHGGGSNGDGLFPCCL